MEILNPTLKALMGLSGLDEEVHHDVEVSLSRDPVTLELCYTIAQVNWQCKGIVHTFCFTSALFD